MVGLIVEEQFLPLQPHLPPSPSSGTGGEWDRWREAQAVSSAHKQRLNDSKGLISSISDFLRQIKNQETGNATLNDVQNLREKTALLSLKWRSRRVLTMVFSDGTIVHLTLKNLFTNHLVVNVDKSLRHHNDIITHVAYAHGIVLFLLEDNRLVIARTYQHRGDGEDAEGGDKGGSMGGGGAVVAPEVTIDTFSDFFPHLAHRRLDKTVTLNGAGDLFVVWWPASKEDVFPWSPKAEDRANILIYQLAGGATGGGGGGSDVGEELPSLVSFLKTDHKLLDVSFHPNPNLMSTLEEEEDGEGKVVMVEIFYDIITMTRESETAIPVQSEITCFAYDLKRSRLALGSVDSSLVIYSQQGRITLVTKTAFIPVRLAWHPDSHLVFVAGERGQYQVFDIALSPLLLLQFGDVIPSVTKEFLCLGTIAQLLWSPWPSSSCDSNLLIEFSSGPMIILRFGFGRMGLVELVNYYLSNGETGEAIKVLKSVYWGSQDCLTALFNIFTRLIRASHSLQVEHELETLLAIFFVPTYGGDDALRKKHTKSMRVLARKFFMWLLLAGKFQRAFQIAVSLGESGLFHKLHHVAASRGEREIASSALGYLTPPPSPSDESHSSYDESYSSDGSGTHTESCSCHSHSSSCSSHPSSSASSRSPSHSSRSSASPSPSPATVTVQERNQRSAEEEESFSTEEDEGEEDHEVVIDEVIEERGPGFLRVLPLDHFPHRSRLAPPSITVTTTTPSPSPAPEPEPVTPARVIVDDLEESQSGDFEESQAVGGSSSTYSFTGGEASGGVPQVYAGLRQPPGKIAAATPYPPSNPSHSSDIEIVHFGLV